MIDFLEQASGTLIAYVQQGTMQALPQSASIPTVSPSGSSYAIEIAIGFIIALVYCLKCRSDMRTANTAYDADSYCKGSSVNFNERADTYINTTVQVIQVSKGNVSPIQR